MLNRLKRLFAEDGGPAAGKHSVDDLHLAAATLLVEAARMDDEFDDSERQAIVAIVQNRFALSDEAVAEVVAAADHAAEHAVELSRFASRLRDGFDHDERAEMIEMLWQVVYADGKVDDHEANLLRRIAGLLYVSDKESGEARKRVLAGQAPEGVAASQG